MKPLEIRFRLATPMLVHSDLPFHFDALMAYAVSRDSEMNGSADPWLDAEDLSEILGREGEGDSWVWQASRMEVLARLPYPKIYESANNLRFTDPSRFYDDLDRGLWQPRGKVNPETFRIDPNSGQQRGYQMYLTTSNAQEVAFYVIGEEEAIRFYLSQVTHLGKGSKNGYGRISNAEIRDCPEAADRWRKRWLHKDMPGADGVEYAPVMGRLRQPYWDKAHFHPVLEPVR
ncbi:type IV CRISPR-associated protein Csf3 [Acidithiobacillus ferrooxidans]|uniref:CRISPR-associated protein, Csf3 family n=1 Tax=Acidithiobacillus ferrooxidans (strain ATCC 23270 / DSM 14882 / CIP 104768 / NCIMB 8455) TaxID=243159 RepID=B7J7Y9_ACIF2|nr:MULTISPECIES: type IV CRISPR-associated protein Csf3 [Acidithiobacillus]ACK78649.1 CRISPR-associated protein, Csf3 family [Acidithiobacillus ferrooxidans ATCC 23270]MBN6744205.1 type IV CRISPR-associated protein Csf3 [Acidithiobacillus sp. MC2.2]MBN6746916.1 type IV CRISPR-associated protein Csf3 [Acidithiobacillus sp. PG05]